MNSDSDNEGLAWQTGVWDKISDVYQEDVEHRFVPVVDAVIGRAEIVPGDHVLDLGTGTGSVALRSASMVGNAVRNLMWNDVAGPRSFRNKTQFIVGQAQ